MNIKNEEEEEEEEEENEEGEEESYPPSVLNRVAALEKIHDSMSAIEEEYVKERIALEKKYHAQRAVSFEQRSKIVSGAVDAEENGNFNFLSFIFVFELYI